MFQGSAFIHVLVDVFGLALAVRSLLNIYTGHRKKSNRLIFDANVANRCVQLFCDHSVIFKMGEQIRCQDHILKYVLQ